MMPTYSHSQLSTYETCPHQYKLAYIDKIEAETESIEAFMGSRVHDALEKLYRDLMKVDKLNTLGEILDFYQQSWEKNWKGMVQIIRKEYSVEDYQQQGKKCIAEYYRRYHPFDHGKTVGLEEYINFPLNGGKDYFIRGYIDRLVRVDQSILEIHDYKTSGKLPSQKEVDSDRQLAFYQIGVQEKWKEIEEVRLIWHYLAFDAEIRSSRKPEDLKKISQETFDLIQRIEADRYFLPKEGPLCNWCDYQPFCPKRKQLVLVENLPLNEYLQEEGVNLVNRYIDLREKKRIFNEEIDAELGKIEEALFSYRQKEKVETILGSDHLVRVNIELKEKYPLKGDPRRKALDDLIKKAGKWLEVSDLNPWMLARLLGRSNWPPDLVRKVKAFATSEESRSITVTKLKEKE
ncbi:MAG TPA: PD-(D/E)XK nuclease family protein [Thermodesulfobacteriota bacterium]|nr:PD-(D/E)XK nuclease family protein [Thermodesulfobacteriota bacterium]